MLDTHQTRSQPQSWANRREHQRVDVQLPIEIRHGGGVIVASRDNLSEGGACINYDGEALPIGERVQMEVALPGKVEPTKVDAEVRWTRSGKLGLQFRGGAKTAIAAFLGVFMASSAASAAASTRVPEFDPQADVVLDMKSGGERPDDGMVLEAFQQQFSAFDGCVSKAKRGRDKQLPGDVDVEVLLNPKGSTPLGVNANMPSKVGKDKGLRECVRSAIAAASYPSYDGPPLVVEFNFELDPGYDYVEEE